MEHPLMSYTILRPSFNLFVHFLLVSSLTLLLSDFPATLATPRLGGNETDRLALLAIKDKLTHDPLSVMGSWNQSIHFCQWHGVTCSRRHQRVTRLDLQSHQLAGPISPHTGNLSFLKVLNLYNNSLSHEIPQEIGQLFRLKQLNLLNNTFEGQIPTNISRCSNLLFLGLGGNKLVGGIPAELGSLTNLQVLLIYNNYLTGGIPPSLGNLSSLLQLSATINFLEGGIPNSLAQLTNLSYFALGANKLSGTIPPSIYNLSSITIFSVPVNKFHGSLPPDLGFTLPNLGKLNIHTNQFTGPIPTSIANASNLMSIQMGQNQFIGKVPSLASLHSLLEMELTENNLGNGEDDDLNFLSSLTNCTSLEFFSIMDNSLGGKLPESLSNFSTNLRILGLGGNQIRGSIPTGIGNLINLGALGIERNQLTGTIPTSIGKLQKLNGLYLNGNKLTGNIPSSLGNLTLLGLINLRRNNLEGSIPSTLGECRNLLSTDLSQNNLTGPIPKEVVSLSSLSISLDLSQNHLTGSLPLEIGKLINLGLLNVSRNKLSDQIPSSLGSCTSLEFLYLEGNFFEGTIPQSLSSLRALQDLDLSSNNFSGQIPRFLESFVFLQNLNLSYNNFEGEVPLQGVFRNASAISIIGNEKLCGGILELKFPMCTTKETNTQRLSLELKLVISIVSGLLGVTLVVTFMYLLRKKKQVPSLQSSDDGSFLKLSYETLQRVTDGFSSANLIGEGSFGCVYKGILEEGNTIVAIKVLNLQRSGAFKSFTAECEALRNIRHRNLVKILTTCSSIDFQGNDFKALVYEFMSNGSLEEWLHPGPSADGGHVEPKKLNLHQRLNIAIDVAGALDYLHHGNQTPIVHCDVKPSNVLLDGDMIAHVGDFGLARFLLSSANQTSSIGLKGSIGYIAPEHGMGSEVSTYSDVYSYGILLLEMFTGKRPTDSMFKDGLHLHHFVKLALPDRAAEVADPIIYLTEIEEQMSTTITQNECQVKSHMIQESLISILGIGVACSAELPKERMDISDVAVELHRIRDNLLGSGIRGHLLIAV